MTGAVPAPGLFLSRVMHMRMRPVKRRFVYRVFSLLLDIDDVAASAKHCRLFSHNRFNVLSFRDRDHGTRDGSPLRPWVEAKLAAAGLDAKPDDVRLLCFPRLWGLVFNPLSVFYCYRAGALYAVLYEVNNTFGQTHTYVLPADMTNGVARHGIDKSFYVSPLLGMDARYEFALRDPDARLSLAIKEFDADGLILSAAQAGERRPLTTWQAVKAVARHPLMTLKILGAIHIEALFLWLRGVPYVPVAPRKTVPASVAPQSALESR